MISFWSRRPASKPARPDEARGIGHGGGRLMPSGEHEPTILDASAASGQSMANRVKVISLP
jgi:hypothetical protein